MLSIRDICLKEPVSATWINKAICLCQSVRIGETCALISEILEIKRMTCNLQTRLIASTYVPPRAFNHVYNGDVPVNLFQQEKHIYSILVTK